MNRLRHRVTHPGNGEASSPETKSLSAPTYGSDSSRQLPSTGPLDSRLKIARQKWAVMKPSSRFWCSVALALFLSYIIFGTMDLFFIRYGLPGETSKGHFSSSFAVAINTFRRPDRLGDTVRHYAEKCGLEFHVGQVFVLWADQETTPPDPNAFFPEQSIRIGGKLPIENRASISVLKLPKDSLNSRFLPIPSLEGKAVFMVDDDVRVACSSLLHGFRAWEANPNAMVGYYPRLASPPHSQGSTESLVYYSWPTVFLRQKFNFILTKACFLNEKYLGLYSSNDHPQEIRDYVDEHMNCEDVAMSLLVANSTKQGNGGRPVFPIFVEGDVTDKGLFGGISTGSGYMSTRSECLTDLTKIYHDRGWGSPLSLDTPLREHSWVHHSPGFWWQSRPSNFFEWFAIGNVFS